MTTVYFVRHCEAEGNLNNTFQGWCDKDITQRGALQLRALARRFAEIPLDAVYTSDLKRAYKTGEAVRGNREIPLMVEPGLREINGGLWEGLPWAEIIRRWPEEYHSWHHDPAHHCCPDGNSFVEVADRVTACVLGLVKENPGKTIAMASHGMALKCCLSRLLGYPMERLYDVPLADNTAVSKIEFHEDGTHQICYMSDNSHLLEEDLSTLAHVDQWWRAPREPLPEKKE